MDEFVGHLLEIIKDHKQKFAERGEIECVYTTELAKAWIDMRVKSSDEYTRRLQAMGAIFEHPDYVCAVKLGRQARNSPRNSGKADEAAALVAKIRASDWYLENSELAGYKLLEKFEHPETHTTDAFVVHTNIVLRLYTYLKILAES